MGFSLLMHGFALLSRGRASLFCASLEAAAGSIHAASCPFFGMGMGDFIAFAFMSPRGHFRILPFNFSEPLSFYADNICKGTLRP
jgi:hypothetical protein